MARGEVTEVRLDDCVVQPGELDWAAQPDEVVANGVANGVPEALAEAARR